MSTVVRSYLDPTTLPLPFCPGCGHATIVERLDQALQRTGFDPKKVVVVTDIGCSGLSDRYFATNAFHGLHGRAVTYATGIKLANPDLHVVVLMGDGGCGIGGHHLINAARRNVGLTVIVFNNLNFAMTGGQHSVATPTGAVTSTTPQGQLERPMDICGTVAVNGASFVARTTTFEADVADLVARALLNDGFSLVDVWELCTAYFAPTNRLGRKTMQALLASLSFPTGILTDAPRPEYARAYRARHAGMAGQPAMPARPIGTHYTSELDRPMDWLLAGAAGKRIGTAAGVLARGAMLSGLWATQRNDYPITVRTGFSTSEVILSPEEVLFTGTAAPDVVLDLFPEGHARVARRIRELDDRATVYRSREVPEPETRARVVTLDFEAAGFGRRRDEWALIAMAAALRDRPVYPLDALRAAAGDAAREAVEAGSEMG